MKILLAVDGSEYTQRMLDYVLAQRSLFDDSHSYTVLNVQPALPHHAASVIGREGVQAWYSEEAEKVLTPAVERLAQHGLQSQGLWRSGPIGETIAHYAMQNSYDMVIMGSHGHGAFEQLVMGSAPIRVLAHCKVPVLLIR